MSFNDYMRVLCIICVAAFAGCGGATDAPDLAKAEGVVLYKDAPLAGAMVTFVVEGSPLATGETNGEGKFVISTGGRPGAPVGSAKVGIVKNKAAAKDTSQLSPEDMIKMAEAGRAVEVNQIVVFTQKGLYTRKIMEAMGLADLQREISDRRQSPQVPERRLAQELKARRDWLREQVRDYVEQQFLLHADVSGKRLREELLRKATEARLGRLDSESTGAYACPPCGMPCDAHRSAQPGHCTSEHCGMELIRMGPPETAEPRTAGARRP